MHLEVLSGIRAGHRDLLDLCDRTLAELEARKASKTPKG
jgi:hypothetical protein